MSDSESSVPSTESVPKGPTAIIPALTKLTLNGTLEDGETKVSPRSNPGVTPKGPLKVFNMHDDSSHNHDTTQDSDSLSAVIINDDIPSPSQQKEIMAKHESESTCSYAVSKSWYKKWTDYVGFNRNKANTKDEPSASSLECPGPLEMDLANDQHNDYVSEEAWKHFVNWYGISTLHQLDRKHLYFKDEKAFDVCVLSPYSGIVEHMTKRFNRFEEIGYIECQMRRIFHIQAYKRTRLWISEKAQVPRFRHLLQRFRMLNDCIHRDKVYILALEEGLAKEHGWPTGEPGEPKGDLTKYDDVTRGPRSRYSDEWEEEVETTLTSFAAEMGQSVHRMAEEFLTNAHQVVDEQVKNNQVTKSAYDKKLTEVTCKEEFLDEKLREIALREERLKLEREHLDLDRTEISERDRALRDEIKQMEEINQIQETKVKLDIGGQIHTTSLQTLKRDPNSLLAAMFSGRHELKKEVDGSYFIDRDGTYFRYVLNFLRDGAIEPGTLPNNIPAMREILREAKYYQMSDLSGFLEDTIAIHSVASTPDHPNGTSSPNLSQR